MAGFSGNRRGLTLKHMPTSPIMRHAKVRGTASPYDGNWSYWASRRGTYPGVPRRLAAHAAKSKKANAKTVDFSSCPMHLIELHHLDGNRHHNKYINLAAVHRHCHDRIHGGQQ